MARVVCVESGLRHVSTLSVRILCNGGLNKTVACRTEPMLHIVICLDGVLGVAKKLGYEQAQVLGGGLNAWKEANLPLEKA